MHNLIYKVLQMCIFSGADLMVLGFKPTGVFCVAESILEGKDTLHFSHVAQATTKDPLFEGLYELTTLWAKPFKETITVFLVQAVDEMYLLLWGLILDVK